MNYEITQELAKSGHQLAVLLGTQHGQLDASSLVQRMAGQLEVLAAVLREKTKHSDAPVVPEDIEWPAEKFCPAEFAGSLLWSETEMWNKAVEACREACRAAMPRQSHERNQVRAEHAQWSQETCGDVGPIGPLKHLAKEALEAAAAPDDLSEWADLQFLLWDAQRRAGITDEQITQAMIDKLKVNKARRWPEPKDGEPRLHIKEQTAPGKEG